MEILKAIHTRRSIRKFKTTPVPMEDIRVIVEAATWAPSGYNQQPWKFIVLRDQEIMLKMYEEVRKKFLEISKWPGTETKQDYLKSMPPGYTAFKEAPVSIAVLNREYAGPIDKIIQKQNFSFEKRYQLRTVPWLQSVAAAIQNMLLAATSLGYGSCYNTGCMIARENLQKILGVAEPWILIAMVPIGVPAHSPHAPKRKSLEKVMEIR